MKKVVLIVVFALLCTSAAIAQDAYPYRALDPRQYNPAVDPNVDMFTNHWSNSVPRVMYGHMVFRDILTGLEGPDPLHPTRKGAVLLEQNAISYATLEPGATAKGSANAGEQQVFYVTGGAGDITTARKTTAIKDGNGFILTPEFEFTLTCTGDEQLTFYVITEPLPDGFEANKELVVKNRFDGTKRTGAHWAHIGNGIIGRGDDNTGRFDAVSGRSLADPRKSLETHPSYGVCAMCQARVETFL